jgi:hypothetical protein
VFLGGSFGVRGDYDGGSESHDSSDVDSEDADSFNDSADFIDDKEADFIDDDEAENEINLFRRYFNEESEEDESSEDFEGVF